MTRMENSGTRFWNIIFMGDKLLRLINIFLFFQILALSAAGCCREMGMFMVFIKNMIILS
jgi:hypothetical protein